jgi:hypothetical protein
MKVSPNSSPCLGAPIREQGLTSEGIAGVHVHHRLPLFCGHPKVHKTLFTLRPVVSGTNGLLMVFSTWLDYKMKELLLLVQSYIKNSYTVLDDLSNMVIPKTAKLFSTDAMSMYTNIDTQTGISAMASFLFDNSTKIPHNFPTALFLHILEIVMENNICCFGDTYWLQLSGTAMGTPLACAYATVSFRQHENTAILPRFASNLIYFKRFIDDIFGIWLPPTNNSTQDSRIHFAMFQKPMNLYLYTPPPPLLLFPQNL